MRRNTSSGSGVGSVMINAPFEGPRAKIRRGRKHLEDLRLIVAEFAGRVQMAMMPVGQMGDMIEYRLRFSERPPADISVLVGDTVHNFRSALDLLICDIGRLRGKSTDKLKFPFAETEEKLEGILSKDIKRLGPDVVEAIRALRPIKVKGHKYLRALHDLDIDDKHDQLVPSYMAAFSRMPIMDAFAGDFMAAFGIDMRQFAAPLSEGSMIKVRKDVNPWEMIEPDPNGPTPVFPRSTVLDGEPVIHTLEHIGNVAEHIVELFAGKFGSRNDPPISPPSGDGGPVFGR